MLFHHADHHHHGAERHSWFNDYRDAVPAVVITLLLAAILIVAAQGTTPDRTLPVWHGNVAQSR